MKNGKWKIKDIMTEEEKKQEELQRQQREAFQKNMDTQRKEAARLKEYANSPITVNTQGQVRPYDEFLKNREMQSLVESDEDKAKREKRERTARKIAALTDGFVALSNLTGAMAGATPFKQSSLSAAHNASARDAAERRRLNARQYEIARQNALSLQRKQDADNADAYDKERKARADAAKRAFGIEQSVGKQEQAQANADRAYQLAKERAEQAAKHQGEIEAQGRAKIGVSQQRESRLAAGGGKKGGGSGNTQADYDEYARWKAAYPKEVEKIREDNAQIDMLGRPTKAVTSTIVKLTNAQMRKKYGSSQQGGNNAGARKKDLSRSGRSGSGKKKSAI